MMVRYVAVCVASCAVSLMLARPALAHDISGVKIGSTLAEASIAVKRANKAFRMKPLKYETGELAGLTAVVGPGDEERTEGAADEFVVMQNKQGKVWYVARYQRMVPGSRLSMEALLGALTTKFGAYAKRSGKMRSRVHDYVWDTDLQGNKVAVDAWDSPCDGTDFERPPIAGVNISRPNRFPSACGVRVMLSDEVVEDGLVSRFTLSIIDVKSAADDSRVERHRRDAELERERKNGNKPQI